MSKYNCERCEDRKYVLHHGRWVACRCLKKLKLMNRYAEANIPPIFREYTWTDLFRDFPHSRKYWRICTGILKKVKKNEKAKFLYIRGNGQSGKQALVSLLLKDFINDGISCKFISLHDMIQMEFDKESRDELDRIYNHYKVVCLRLGTVMQHKMSRYVLEKFYNARRNNNLYAIFTSRLDISKDSNSYGIELKKLIKDGRRVLKIKMGKPDAE